jgi:formylglycine-generating enzyme required for sulfatase activity
MSSIRSIVNDYFLGKPDSPVIYVSWRDAMKYAKWVGKWLPTEAEWEYACRAGSTTRYHFGDDESQLGEYAWYEANSGGRPHPVGQKKSNAWGLYDMHGNAREWCLDSYHPDYYGYSPLQNPTGPSIGLARLGRGGSWATDAYSTRSAARLEIPRGLDPCGFRCALDVVPDPGGQYVTFGGNEP